MNLGRAVLAAVLFIIACPTWALSQDAFTAKVIGVNDGDTLTVLRDRTSVKIRLDGVDAPESGQAFGNRAKQAASALAFEQLVTVRPREHDRYGRLVVEVIVPDGRDLNEELVRQGWAWWFRRYAPDNATLAALESEAREARRGLWADQKPMAPWEWRAAQRGVGASPPSVPGPIIANRRSSLYHTPGCRTYEATSPENRVLFGTTAEAEAAGLSTRGKLSVMSTQRRATPPLASSAYRPPSPSCGSCIAGSTLGPAWASSR